MTPLRLHHVQITVKKNDVEQARAFYCGVLGLSEIAKPVSLEGRGGFWLECGGQEIHLGTEEGFDRYSTKAHLAYQVEHLSVWRERLEHSGCVVLESIPVTGFERFETRDPFGNRLEFIERLD